MGVYIGLTVMGIYYFYNQKRKTDTYSENLEVALILKTIISLPPNHQYKELL